MDVMTLKITISVFCSSYIGNSKLNVLSCSMGNPDLKAGHTFTWFQLWAFQSAQVSFVRGVKRADVSLCSLFHLS